MRAGRLACLHKGKQFVASNEEFPRLRIDIEMLGKGDRAFSSGR